MNTELFFSSILVGGGATVIATQILKSKYIPVAFEKYPKGTAVVVSLVASIVAEVQANQAVDWHNLGNLAALFVGTLWVAVSVYNHLVKGSTPA